MNPSLLQLITGFIIADRATVHRCMQWAGIKYGSLGAKACNYLHDILATTNFCTPAMTASGNRGASRRNNGASKRNKKGAIRKGQGKPRSFDASIGKYRVIATLAVAAIFVAAIFSLARLETPATRPQTSESRQPAENTNSNNLSQFSFYSLLKDFEIEVPDSTATANGKTRDKAGEKKANYVIQAGSFKTAGQAEQRLVELKLLGLEPTVGEVTNANGERWHRVLLGPFSSRSQMAGARSVIISNNIEAMVMRRTR